MRSKSGRSRVIALFMTVAMVFSLITVFGAEQSKAASKKYSLPSKIVVYKYEDGTWDKIETHTFKYDSRGNVTNWNGFKVDNTYKDGKLNRVSVSRSGYEFSYIKKYNSKGKITSSSFKSDDFDLKLKYSYNKKGYIYKWTNTTDTRDSLYLKLQFKYYSNGRPSKITRPATDSFEYKYIENYDKSGLAESGKGYKGGKLNDSYEYKYTRDSNGRITQSLETHKKDGKVTIKYKYKYSYGTAKTTSKTRARAMIAWVQENFLIYALGNNNIIGGYY